MNVGYEFCQRRDVRVPRLRLQSTYKASTKHPLCGTKFVQAAVESTLYNSHGNPPDSPDRRWNTDEHREERRVLRAPASLRRAAYRAAAIREAISEHKLI